MSRVHLSASLICVLQTFSKERSDMNCVKDWKRATKMGGWVEVGSSATDSDQPQSNERVVALLAQGAKYGDKSQDWAGEIHEIK